MQEHPENWENWKNKKISKNKTALQDR